MYRVGTSVESPQVRAMFRIENSVSLNVISNGAEKLLYRVRTKW